MGTLGALNLSPSLSRPARSLAARSHPPPAVRRSTLDGYTSGREGTHASPLELDPGDDGIFMLGDDLGPSVAHASFHPPQHCPGS